MAETEPFTPGDWVVEEYEPLGGYDCMTGCMHVGPVELDGVHYGQKSCQPISAEELAMMTADAHLIAAAKKLLAACKSLLEKNSLEAWDSIRAAVKAAERKG